MIVAGVDIEHHAPWCAGGCPRWLATGAPGCLPIPCQCRRTRDEAPEWARRQGQDRCWWQKKGLEDTPGGGYRSRCPCWGGVRDGRPGGCCAHHSANPHYAAVLITGSADPDAPDATAAVEPADEPLDIDMPPGEPGEPDWAEFDWPDEIREPYVRRWGSAELTCECVLPYAKDARCATVHCVTCCTDWANPGTFAIHRPLWTQPCRDPWKIRDVATGRSLLYQDGEGIWRDSYPGEHDGVTTAAGMAA